MKSLGYCQKVVSLCDRLDKKFLELLADISQYLYGRELSDATSTSNNLRPFDRKLVKKFLDREELENYLTVECATNSTL